MFRLNKSPVSGSDFADLLGALIVAIKLIGAVMSFLEQLPRAKKDRVAELEARINKLESVLAEPASTP